MVTAEAHNAAAAGGAFALGRRQRQRPHRAAGGRMTAGCPRRRFRPADPWGPGWGKWQTSESGAAIMPAPERTG